MLRSPLIERASMVTSFSRSSRSSWSPSANCGISVSKFLAFADLSSGSATFSLNSPVTVSPSGLMRLTFPFSTCEMKVGE